MNLQETELAIKQEKEKILYKREVECRDTFTELLGKWQKSQAIHQFLKDYEEKVLNEKGAIVPDSNEALLIEWAKDYAERLNPINNNSLSELTEKIRHRLDEPNEKESYEYSELLWKLDFYK